MKICTKCRRSLSLDAFSTRTMRGKKYLRPHCKDCDAENKVGYTSPAYSRYKLERANGERQAHWICLDARKSDRKRGRDNDLDLVFVETLIMHGCAYCGETMLRMTLDRIDNRLGHLKTNVVPACERCNYMRRDMPYAAWYALLPALRFAREQGLFGTWTGTVHRRGE